MADRKLIGKVVDMGGNPVPGADVWLSGSAGPTLQGKTGEADAAGEFSFDLDDAWPEGSATLSVRPAASPLVEKQQVYLAETGAPPQLVKVHDADKEISARAGGIFMLVASVALLVLGWFYLDLHGVTRAKLEKRQPIAVDQARRLSAPLADTLETAKEQVESARKALEALEPVKEDPPEKLDSETEIEEAESADEGGEPDPDDEVDAAENPARQALKDAMVGDSLKTAEEIFAGLKKSRIGLLGDDKVQALDGLFLQADAALEAGAVDALDATLDRLLDQVEDERAVFLWEDEPGRFLEVMFWALAATLLRLIFNAGYYLYKSSFLASAIPHHLALIVIIPIVAVVISFVLTLVTVDLQLGENVLTLDMSNVLIAIVVAVLIGLSPWESWRFLYQLADLLFTKLASWFKMSDRDATE